MLLPQSRTSDWRSSSLRLSLFVWLTMCIAMSLTLRLCLIFLSSLIELALLVPDTCRRKVRENHPRRPR